MANWTGLVTADKVCQFLGTGFLMGEMVEKHGRARDLGAMLYEAGFRTCWFQTTWADVQVPYLAYRRPCHIISSTLGHL